MIRKPLLLCQGSFVGGEMVKYRIRNQIGQPRGLQRVGRKVDTELEICLTAPEPSATGVRPSRC